MEKNQELQIVAIEDKKYDLSTFTQEQRILLEHCMDLDKKIASCQFQFDQLRVGKDAFLSILKKSLQETKNVEIED